MVRSSANVFYLEQSASSRALAARPVSLPGIYLRSWTVGYEDRKQRKEVLMTSFMRVIGLQWLLDETS